MTDMTDTLELDDDSSDIRLKSSSHRIDLRRLPEPFLDAVSVFMSRSAADPVSMLALFGHMFAGLHVNEIRDRMVIIDGNTVKHPSREIIRKNLVAMYAAIKQIYVESAGERSVSPLYPHDTIASATMLGEPVLQTLFASKEEAHERETQNPKGTVGESEDHQAKTETFPFA